MHDLRLNLSFAVQSYVKTFLLSSENHLQNVPLPPQKCTTAQNFSQPFQKPDRHVFTLLCICTWYTTRVHAPLPACPTFFSRYLVFSFSPLSVHFCRAPLSPAFLPAVKLYAFSVRARSPCMHFGQKIVHRAPLRVFNSCSHTLPVFSTQSVSLREDVYLFRRGSANDEQMLERNCEH